MCESELDVVTEQHWNELILFYGGNKVESGPGPSDPSGPSDQDGVLQGIRAWLVLPNQGDVPLGVTDTLPPASIGKRAFLNIEPESIDPGGDNLGQQQQEGGNEGICNALSNREDKKPGGRRRLGRGKTAKEAPAVLDQEKGLIDLSGETTCPGRTTSSAPGQDLVEEGQLHPDAPWPTPSMTMALIDPSCTVGRGVAHYSDAIDNAGNALQTVIVEPTLQTDPAICWQYFGQVSFDCLFIVCIFHWRVYCTHDCP